MMMPHPTRLLLCTLVTVQIKYPFEVEPPGPRLETQAADYRGAAKPGRLVAVLPDSLIRKKTVVFFRSAICALCWARGKKLLSRRTRRRRMYLFVAHQAF